MPTARKYNNDNLNIISYKDTDRFYNNDSLPKDKPPDVPDDVVDAPPDVIDTKPEPAPSYGAKNVGMPEADTFDSGFMRAILNGDAWDASKQSLAGYAKKAIDIPGSIINGVSSLYHGIQDKYAQRDNPEMSKDELYNSLNKRNPGNFLDSMDAGANPEAFGETMGELTGQPLLTAGILKGGAKFGPSAIRGAGHIAEFGGGILEKHQPASAVIPRMFEPRITRIVEKAVGKGIKNVGQKMQGFGKSNIAEAAAAPDVVDGQVLSSVSTPNRKALPPSKTSFYAGDGRVKDTRSMRERIAEIEALPEETKEAVVKAEAPVIEKPVTTKLVGEDLSSPKPKKPAVRLNQDGTYTRIDTGEVVDAQGRDIPISEKPVSPVRTAYSERKQQLDNERGMAHEEAMKDPDYAHVYNQVQEQIKNGTVGEPINHLPPKPRTIDNAPPNQRAKLYRGAHDPVDVLFEDSDSRDIFGSGQNMFRAGKSVDHALVQRFADTSARVANKFGISIQEARKGIGAYNRHIRELSKSMPKSSAKIGDLHFKAPSFTEFLKTQK